jgi:hypothetical protein
MTPNVCKHEASHAAAAIALGRDVAYIERDTGATRVGERLGHARIPVDGPIEPSQLVVCLAGYMGDGGEGWPPPWPDALDEPRERLGIVIRRLSLTEADYNEVVGLVRDVLADEDFRRLRDAIARALSAAPRLEREDLAALAAIYPIREQETANAA